MFRFAEESSAALAHYRNFGLALLLLQLSLYVFGLPPFSAGIWLQTEPDMVALFTCAAAGAAWLLVGVWRGLLVRQPVHSLWQCLLLWICWQMAVSAFAPSPWRSWFGPAEMGEGVGWHLALLLAVMLAYPLWQVERCRRLLLVAAGANIVAQALLHVFFTDHNAAALYVLGSWSPAQWGDYLAFMAGYFWLLVMCAGTVRTAAAYAGLLLFSFTVLYISHNDAGMVIAGAAMLASFVAHLLEKKAGLPTFLQPSAFWRRMALLACLAPMLWVGFGLAYSGSGADGGDGSFPPLSDKDSPLGSRIGLIQVAGAALANEPHRWVMGNGWGEFTDSMFKYALVDGVYVFHNGQRDPNWAFVDGRAYHSHCQPLETLLALGLPGMALWFALPMLVILALPAALFWSCAPVVAALVAMAYFWFQLPQCVPYQALALAALFSQCGAQARPREGVRGCWLKAGLGVAALMMAWSASQQWQAMRYGEKLHDVAEDASAPLLPLDWLARDLPRGGDRLRASATGYAVALGRESAVNKLQRDWYGRYMEAAHAAALAPRSGARTVSLEVWLQYKLLLDLGFPAFAELGHQAVLDLPEAVIRTAKAAPLRDDMATNLLLNLPDITHGDTARQAEILRGILAVAPSHRGALWVLGHLLRQSPDTEKEGDAMMHRAAALGVERVFPVTDSELAPFR